MISEQAIVTQVNQDSIQLMVERVDACGACEQTQACGTGALARLIGQRQKPIIIDRQSNKQYDVKVGDKVELELSEKALIQASLMVYGLPLFGLILVGTIATGLSLPQWSVALLSVAGLFGAMKLVPRLVSIADEVQISPSIVSIIGKQNSKVESSA